VNYRKILDEKIQLYFPENESQSVILNELKKYGVEKHEIEIDRVYLSIIKCANGNIDKIGEFVKIAKHDYRDIIARAEYPNQFENGFTDDKELSKILEKKDKKQFQEWIKNKG
jgi:hypothetical protein